jgi:hypothetical protein
MSTFDSTINSGAAYLVRDIYQAFIRAKAGRRELVYAGYAASTVIVVAGCLLGLKAESIASIWNWIMMALGAGLLLPDMLKWYWWRFNGWGYMAGSASGVTLSLAQALFFPEMSIYVYFPIIGCVTLAVSAAVALATKPVPKEELAAFFKQTRPWGFWGPVRRSVGITVGSRAGDSPRRDLPNAAVGVVGLMGLYVAPLYFMIHSYGRAAVGLALAAAAAAVLYRTWYRNLPDN